jgi:hypothetical protein
MTTINLYHLLPLIVAFATWSVIFTNSEFLNKYKKHIAKVSDMTRPSIKGWLAYMFYCTKCHAAQFTFVTSLLLLKLPVLLCILVATTTAFVALEIEGLVIAHNVRKELNRKQRIAELNALED